MLGAICILGHTISYYFCVTLAEVGTTAATVMAKAWEYSAVVVVVLGERPPQRYHICWHHITQAEAVLSARSDAGAQPVQFLTAHIFILSHLLDLAHAQSALATSSGETTPL